MATLVLRQVKGSPITDPEMDANFTNLNRDSFLSVRNSTPWVATTAFTKGEVINVLDRFYLVTGGGISGSSAPTHTTGSASNGSLTLQVITPQYYSAKDVLDKLKTLHGVGSGLDADLLRGLPTSSTLPTIPDKSSIVSRDAAGNSTFNNVNLNVLYPTSVYASNGLGTNGQFLTATGAGIQWTTVDVTPVVTSDTSANVRYPVFVDGTGTQPLKVNSSSLAYYPATNILFVNVTGNLTGVASGNPKYSANTYTGDQTVPNQDYNATTWNLNYTVPTKHAIRNAIETLVPKNVVDTGTASKINRQNTSSEGGQLEFARASDNASAWYLDVNGLGSTPTFRLVNKNLNNGGTEVPALLLDINNSIYAAYPGTGTLGPAFLCRAWVRFDGVTSSMNGSGNVSNIQKIGTGIYRINFSAAQPDTSYCVNVTASINYTTDPLNAACSCWTLNHEQTYCYVCISDNNSDSLRDARNINVTIFR